jgi:hypothetical protein
MTECVHKISWEIRLGSGSLHSEETLASLQKSPEKQGLKLPLSSGTAWVDFLFWQICSTALA